MAVRDLNGESLDRRERSALAGVHRHRDGDRLDFWWHRRQVNLEPVPAAQTYRAFRRGWLVEEDKVVVAAYLSVLVKLEGHQIHRTLFCAGDGEDQVWPLRGTFPPRVS